jgi:hypothetical protein
MKRKTTDFKRVLYILIILIITARISSQEQQNSTAGDTLARELMLDLDQSETIIDYDIEGSSLYVLLHKKILPEERIFFAVYHKQDNGSWDRIYENDFTSRKPWKLEAADIDGDGETEILVSVVKTTTFDPIEKNRMFIFNFDNKKLFKKWTGSQIAGIWSDFFVGDLISAPGNELIFVEQTKDNREKLSVYSWFDFGFFCLAESEGYSDIKDVIILGDNQIQLTWNEEKKQKTGRLQMLNGKLVEVNQVP